MAEINLELINLQPTHAKNSKANNNSKLQNNNVTGSFSELIKDNQNLTNSEEEKKDVDIEELTEELAEPKVFNNNLFILNTNSVEQDSSTNNAVTENLDLIIVDNDAAKKLEELKENSSLNSIDLIVQGKNTIELTEKKQRLSNDNNIAEDVTDLKLIDSLGDELEHQSNSGVFIKPHNEEQNNTHNTLSEFFNLDQQKDVNIDESLRPNINIGKDIIIPTNSLGEVVAELQGDADVNIDSDEQAIINIVKSDSNTSKDRLTNIPFSSKFTNSPLQGKEIFNNLVNEFNSNFSVNTDTIDTIDTIDIVDTIDNVDNDIALSAGGVLSNFTVSLINDTVIVTYSDVNSTNNVQFQVVKAVEIAISNGVRKIELSVMPANLGKIDITIEMSANQEIKTIIIAPYEKDTLALFTDSTVIKELTESLKSVVSKEDSKLNLGGGNDAGNSQNNQSSQEANFERNFTLKLHNPNMEIESEDVKQVNNLLTENLVDMRV